MLILPAKSRLVIVVRTTQAIPAIAALVLFAISLTTIANPQIVAPIPSFQIQEGGVFPPLDLNTLVHDSNYTNDELTWRVVKANFILAAVVEHTAFFAAPHTDWYGSDTIVFEVCNPAGECTTCEIKLEVVPINDPPLLSLSHQIATDCGQPFTPIDLTQYATDIDDDDAALQWSVEGQRSLIAEIHDGVLIVEPPDEAWIGTEDLTVRVCDAEGSCAEGVIQFVVADEDALTIRLIDNAGFQLRWRNLCVMIDSVYRDSAYRFPELTSAAPPFDADLLLFTHSHADHFDPDVVVLYMTALPDVLLVAPQDAVHRVLQIDPSLEDRVTSIVLERETSLSLERHGIPITLFDFPHGGTPNIGYLVELGEYKILHTGDISLSLNETWQFMTTYAMAERDVTVSLTMPRFFTSGTILDLYRVHVAANIYIPIHVKPGSFSYYHQLANQQNDILVIDELLEAWVIPGK